MPQTLKHSPLWTVCLVGLGALVVLVARGLDIGPLHTDVLIHRAWFSEVGPEGFTKRYLDWNQRHLLVGPVNAAAYVLFEEHDAPYNVIFQASRIFEGVFMAGIVYQLVQRRWLAICAGLAVMFTPIRLPELYQGINWYIEPTLTLLLASSYYYLLSLRLDRIRWLLYALSVVLYSISVLIYESGLPWIAVNMFLGWIALVDQRWRDRLWRVVRDALPIIAVGIAVMFIVLFVFEPWEGLAPNEESISIGRFVVQIGSIVTFPGVYARVLRFAVHDGYMLRIILLAVLAGISLPALARLAGPHDETNSSWRDFGVLFALAVVMVFAGVLLGTVNNETGTQLVDRLTFGRAPGIALFYVTLIFAVSEQVTRARWGQIAAVAAAGALLIGPGFAFLLTYQDYAQDSRREIDRLTAAVLAVRPTLYRPVHLVILTPEDWVTSRFVDASDVILHEVQQNLWEQGGDATIDILTRGSYAEDYAVYPGTCETLTGQASTGICLAEDEVYSSRWAIPAALTHPNEDVVILRYDAAAGTMTVLPRLEIEALDGYNIATAGPGALETNPARVAD